MLLLDRSAKLRTSSEDLSSRDDALFTFTWRNRNLVTNENPPKPVLLDRNAAAELRERAVETAFLGMLGEHPCFAASLPGAAEDADLAKGHGHFNDLRMIGQFVADADARLLGYARGILHWHRHHQHCGKCGAKTTNAEAGHVRVCEGCEKRHFPRTDAAIMALIVRGERMLLARQPKWPQGMYSLLAGFIEPGESIEDAVAREVREEVGLEVTDMLYVSSQPWPFPSSLMIGYVMRSDDGDIALGDDELEEARWVTREEIADEDKKFFVPPPFSLAGQLIASFMKDALPL